MKNYKILIVLIYGRIRDRAFVIWFADLSIKDVGLVGGKNASLGDMYAHLKDQGVDVPNGFAITSQAYKFFIQEAGLEEKIQNILDGIKKDDIDSLRAAGEEIRNLILSAQLPQSLNAEIEKAYQKLCELYEENTDVAVRSSATAEDLPGASLQENRKHF